MGQQVAVYFSRAESLGGVQAKVRLAQITRTTSTEALSVQDDAPTLKRFASAWDELQREFSGGAGALSGPQVARAPQENPSAVVERLRRHARISVELLSQRALFLADLEKTLRRTTEAAAEALDVARSSVWFLDEHRSKICCADLFERASGTHSAGTELHATQFPGYFKAVAKEKTIAAHDAHKDPRTAEFSDVYLKPLKINSMLDVPIWVRGKMVGVICNEHTGQARLWNADEETFAYLLGNIVAVAMETSSK